jgi:hypothetical protein
VAAAGVAGFEPAARGVECAELDGHAGADADEGRQRALVEGEGALVLVDGGGGFEGACVLGRCLETDFDDVKGLAWQVLVTGGCCDAKPWESVAPGRRELRRSRIALLQREKKWNRIPIKTCAMPPTAPEKRSFAVWSPPPCCCSSSTSAMFSDFCVPRGR